MIVLTSPDELVLLLAGESPEDLAACSTLEELLGERITDKQVIETFKCATGSGWGILIDGNMDCDIPYFRTEAEALAWIELLSGLK